MTPELRHLRYLLAVAEHGNFTRAAEELHVSQPTLSQQIRQLERLVGVALLDRTGRSVRLTDAGVVYTDHARRALRELTAADRAVHDVEDLTRGTLRLAVTPTFTAYLVGPLVAEFHAEHPGITLEVIESAQEAMESAILADEIDLGIAFAGTSLPGIETTALFEEALSLVVGEHHRPDTPLPVTALADAELALLSRDFVTRGHIDDYLSAHGMTPRITVEANAIHSVLEIVRRTTLLTVLPPAIAAAYPGLTTLDLDPPLPTRTVALLRRDHAYRSAAARAFTQLCGQWVRTRFPPPRIPERKTRTRS
ncbi:transcriptional regulator CynR [Nocardia sp. ET3-3]|uniref:Transcriptional regulator CynR n=1 Tax=Nocardia terrae TaxID=2675851 RepID=A0A7K1VBC1_9NOCA|nr:transcriptional regulator CynR [Nocardia terrae]